MPPATLFVVFIFEVSEMSMGITTKKVLLALGLASAVAGFSMNAAFAADDEDHPVCQEGQKCDKPMSGNKKMDKKDHEKHPEADGKRAPAPKEGDEGKAPREPKADKKHPGEEQPMMKDGEKMPKDKDHKKKPPKEDEQDQ